MTQSIPISNIVNVVPSSIGTGGNALALNSIMLDNDAKTPLSSILQFSSSDDVGAYYGTSSTQYDMAIAYFTGPNNATVLPSKLYFAGYASAATAAWLRGTSIAGMTIATLQAISGTMSVTINGTVYSAALNFSAIASFTAAATYITTTLAIGSVATCTWDATYSKFACTATLTGSGKTIALATGTPAVSLGLSTGVVSNGYAIDTPSSAMARIKTQTLNWATFMTTFEPVIGDKTLFAAWTSAQNKRYMYVAWDSDSAALTADNSASFGKIVDANSYEGTLPVYSRAIDAAYVCSWAASINWSARNGRMTLAFREFSGASAVVSTQAAYDALISNGYSFLGFYAAPGDGNEYTFMYNGQMDGSIYSWADTYINQIRLNAQLQLAVIEGLLAINSAPYNQEGYSYIRAWCQDPIDEGVLNGTIRSGVTLSNSQKATIMQTTGVDVSSDLNSKGYYLYIGDATAQVRGNRQSPPIYLYYTDGGAIQQITIDSIAVL